MEADIERTNQLTELFTDCIKVLHGQSMKKTKSFSLLAYICLRENGI